MIWRKSPMPSLKWVFDALRALMAPPMKPKRKIGFDLKEKQSRYGRKIHLGK
jgi:hypothetical protein